MRKNQSKTRVIAPVMDPQRGVLNRIRARAKRFGFKIGDVRPVRLRLYHKLTNNNSTLNFQTNVVNQKHPMEVLIDKSDAVWASKIGLGIHKVLINNGEEYPANTPVVHYEDPNWFTGGAIAPGWATETQALSMLYNADLMIKTDQDIRLDNYDTSQLRCVPEVQYDAGPPIKLSQYNGDEMHDIVTNVGLWGNKRNQIQITLKDGDYSAIAGVPDDHQNYAVLFIDGFILVRGAESVTLSDAAQLFK